VAARAPQDAMYCGLKHQLLVHLYKQAVAPGGK
jgi:hypothetical protein